MPACFWPDPGMTPARFRHDFQHDSDSGRFRHLFDAIPLCFGTIPAQILQDVGNMLSKVWHPFWLYAPQQEAKNKHGWQ
jgi:hypothetical protein